jgi:murein DD-endopeptidase MepM/ murein hydrolase activator NlpD
VLNTLLPTSARAVKPLRGFLNVRRRSLAAATMAMSAGLVVVHDLPALAATSAPAQETVVGSQTLHVSTEVAESEESAPLLAETAEYDITHYTPVQYPVDPGTTLTSHFGHRKAPCGGCSTNHSGVDWTPGYGAPVHAIADGVVISRPMGGWGSYVLIEHNVDGERVISGYAHLVAGSNLPVGATVKRGEVVGLAGNTGQTSGAHLHFSILVNDDFVDPLTWLQNNVTEGFPG